MVDPRNALVGHAIRRIGNDAVMFADSMEGREPTKTLLRLYVNGVDAS
jgi:hypothetical protein